MTLFAVFLAVVAGLMALALIALVVTLAILAVRSRGAVRKPMHYRND